MAEVALSVQLKKMYGKPINPDSVFESMEAAMAYVTGPLGAPGEIFAVYNNDGTESYSAYIINKDKTITKIAGGSETDLSEIIDSLTWKTLD